MTNNLKRQVEVQGMKKLDNVKGVQALDARELQEIEGGILPAIAVGMAVLYIVGTVCGLSQGKRLNGMP